MRYFFSWRKNNIGSHGKLAAETGRKLFWVAGKRIALHCATKKQFKVSAERKCNNKKRGGKQMRRKSIPVFEDAASGQEYVEHLLKHL